MMRNSSIAPHGHARGKSLAPYIDPNGCVYTDGETFSWRARYIPKVTSNILEEVLHEMAIESKAGYASFRGRLLSDKQKLMARQVSDFSISLPRFRGWEDAMGTFFAPLFVGWAVNYFLALVGTGLEIAFRCAGKPFEKMATACWNAAVDKKQNWLVRGGAAVGAAFLGACFAYPLCGTGKFIGYLKRTIDAVANAGSSFLTLLADHAASWVRKKYPEQCKKIQETPYQIRLQDRNGKRYPTLYVCAQAFLKGLLQMCFSPIIAAVDPVVSKKEAAVKSDRQVLEMANTQRRWRVNSLEATRSHSCYMAGPSMQSAINLRSLSCDIRPTDHEEKSRIDEVSSFAVRSQSYSPHEPAIAMQTPSVSNRSSPIGPSPLNSTSREIFSSLSAANTSPARAAAGVPPRSAATSSATSSATSRTPAAAIACTGASPMTLFVNFCTPCNNKPLSEHNVKFAL